MQFFSSAKALGSMESAATSTASSRSPSSGAGFVMPSTMLKFWIIVIGYTLANFGQYGFYLVMMISILNTVEYNEYKYGTRDEAIIASLRPFLTKMASAVVVAVTSASYIIFGVTDYTNRISSFESAAAAGTITEAEKLSAISEVIGSVSSSQTLGLLIAVTVLPFVLMLISHLLYQKKYTLDEDEYERICKELENRTAEV